MNNFDNLPERLEKSEQSLVIKEAIIVNPCHCITCGTHYGVTLQSEAIIIDNQLINHELPKNFHCPMCNSTYIKWEVIAEIIQ